MRILPSRIKSSGPEANDGDVVYILVVHGHDMLGQAIAYARVNGIVLSVDRRSIEASAGLAGGCRSFLE